MKPSAPPDATATAEQETFHIISIATLNKIAWTTFAIQAIIAFTAMSISFVTDDINYSVGASSIMFSFGLVGWAATLPEGTTPWPFFLSVFCLPLVADAGLLTRGANYDGFLLFLVYGIIPLITRSFPWFISAMVTKNALNYNSVQAIQVVWRFILGALPVFFIASGGMVGGHFEDGHYKQYSEGWIAFVALFQCHVVQIVLLSTEVWNAGQYTSFSESFKRFEVYEWISVVNMYLMVVVALCFGTVLSLLQKIWYPLEYLMGVYWFLGPMVQLLSMWRVSKNALVRNCHHDNSGHEVEVVTLEHSDVV